MILLIWCHSTVKNKQKLISSMIISQSIIANPNPTYRVIAASKNFMAFPVSNALILYSFAADQNILLIKSPFKSTICSCLMITENDSLVLTAGYLDSGKGGLAIFEIVPPYSDYKVLRSINFQKGIIGLCRTPFTDLPLFSDSSIGIDKYHLKLSDRSRVQVGLYLDWGLVAFGSVDKCVHIYEIDQSRLKFLSVLKGHPNAISDLASAPFQKGYILAVASKDGSIRLWKIGKHTPLKIKDEYFIRSDIVVSLSSVLYGHQSNVSGLCWWSSDEDLHLFSSSLDATIIAWQQQQTGGWINRYRLGQMAGNKNAFFSISFINGYLYGVSYTGAIYKWKVIKEGKKLHFSSQTTLKGHFKPVSDVCFSKDGKNLVSCSQDQTARVFSQDNKGQWIQTSRVQVHGFDLNRIRFIPAAKNLHSNCCQLILSGADQKVLRVLEPSTRFINIHNKVSDSQLRLNFSDLQAQQRQIISKTPIQYKVTKEGGLQVLGLMTKNLKIQAAEQEQSVSVGTQPQLTPQVPAEQDKYTQDYLTLKTLWPQINKLYGHSHQISALAISLDGTEFASACSSLTSQDASILVWDSATFKILKKLSVHKSTVTDLAYSKKNLFAVAKDRHLSITRLCDREVQLYQQIHLRAITFVSYNRLNDLVLTGSKDKTIKVHFKPAVSISLEDRVSAGTWVNGSSLLVAGTQSGVLCLLNVSEESHQIRLISKVQGWHSKIITRLSSSDNHLCSCSKDHCIRLFRIAMDK